MTTLKEEGDEPHRARLRHHRAGVDRPGRHVQFGGQEQIEGSLLAVALGGLGFGTGRPGRTSRKAHTSRARGAAVERRGPGGVRRRRARRGWLSRRGFLLKMLGLAGGAIGIAALFPIRSLGPNPGQSLFRTKWRRGSLVVDEQGEPVGVDTLDVGGALTVFPQGTSRSRTRRRSSSACHGTTS